MMADCQIASVYLSVSGKHIGFRNESGMVPISDEEVTADDVDNGFIPQNQLDYLMNIAFYMFYHKNFQLIIKKVFEIPWAIGIRMEANVHLITCHNDMARNIEKCVERVGLQVSNWFFLHCRPVMQCSQKMKKNWCLCRGYGRRHHGFSTIYAVPCVIVMLFLMPEIRSQ